jgi:hypothetical protein
VTREDHLSICKVLGDRGVDPSKIMVAQHDGIRFGIRQVTWEVPSGNLGACIHMLGMGDPSQEEIDEGGYGDHYTEVGRLILEQNGNNLEARIVSSTLQRRGWYL